MNNFREEKLGPSFASEKMAEFVKLINACLSFVVVSMPGVGVSYFLKYLATRDFAYFVHVDLYSLPNLSQFDLYKLLLTELGGKPDNKIKTEEILEEIKQVLIKLSQKREKIVIIFSRFDQLKKVFDASFLSNIQSLTSVANNKIVLIFTSTKPLYDIAPDALTGGNLNFYSEELYFSPYSKKDLEKLCLIEPLKPINKHLLDNLIELSGGHNQLLHILLSSQRQNNLLMDRFVKLQMKELVDYLDYFQRKTVQKIALGKNITEVDDYLLGIGMLTKTNKDFKLFTPLFAEYIKTNMPVKLPLKESRLFKLLKQNMGDTVSKDEIFEAVWGENNEDATDWALDALIYRLRKHPFMQANGYIIESHKKIGYTLIQT